MQKETRSATKTQERCNLVYGKTNNPNFFCRLFLDRTKTKTNLRG
jgi:hypothetical protein